MSESAGRLPDAEDRALRRALTPSLYVALAEFDAKLAQIHVPSGMVVTIHLQGHRVEFHPLKEKP